MKIGFDARLLLNDLRGIGVYLFNLLNQLLEQGLGNEYILYVNESSPYITTKASSSPVIEKLRAYPEVTIRNISAPNDFLWEQLLLPIQLTYDKPDILHMPANRAPRICPCKLVVTVHDVIELLFFDQFFYTQKTLRGRFYDWRTANYMKYMYYRIFPRADKIITVSNTSKKDIHNMLNIPLDRIAVVHQSYNSALRPADAPTRDYLFTLGCVAAHKNSVAVIKAYNLLPQQLREKYKLEIVGCCPELKSLVDSIGDPNIKLKNSDFSIPLDSRYGNAIGFVYPSLYEGFGLPVLEAMACGTPVIASNKGSIPEVAGDAALYIDPEDIGSIANAMEKLLTDRLLRDNLMKKGFDQLRKYSWQTCARKTHAVYEQTINSQPIGKKNPSLQKSRKNPDL